MIAEGKFSVTFFDDNGTRYGTVEINLDKPNRYLRCVFEIKEDGEITTPQGFEKYGALLTELCKYASGANDEAKKYVRRYVSDAIIESYVRKDPNKDLQQDVQELLKTEYGQ